MVICLPVPMRIDETVFMGLILSHANFFQANLVYGQTLDAASRLSLL